MPPAAACALQQTLAALDAKKAEALKHIPLVGKSVLADVLVIATGTSDRHVEALARTAAEALANNGLTARFEGLEDGQWVVVDAGDVVVHLFQAEARALYKLDDMWTANLAETLTEAIDAA